MNKTNINGVLYTEKELNDIAVLKRLLAGWDERYKLVKGEVVKREQIS